MSREYFYEIKSDGKNWECPQKAYYSFLNGAMNYAYHQGITDKKLERRIVEIENKTVLNIYKLNTHNLKLWFENRLKEGKEKILMTFSEELRYIFEVSVEKTEDTGLIIKWENPAGISFDSPFFVWAYVLRNADNFSGKRKRMKTLNADTGEIAYMVSIDDNFIKNMEKSREFLKSL